MAPRTNRKISPTDCYHVAVLGCRNDIWQTGEDKDLYIAYLMSNGMALSGRVHGYCVLNSQAHIIISGTLTEISQIMRETNRAYTQYFQKKYGCHGTLFCGRFKSDIIITADMKAPVLTYVHYLPVIYEICELPVEYPYSSAKYYDTAENKAQGCFEKLPNLYVKKPLDFFHLLEYNLLNDFTAFENNYIYKRIIERYLQDVNLSLSALEDDRQRLQELISILRQYTGISIRKVSELLHINRGVVYTILSQTDKGDY